jgi:hypothetical protein
MYLKKAGYSILNASLQVAAGFLTKSKGIFKT